MSKTRILGKDLLSHMEAAGLTEYGSVITGETVRGVLGIKLPRTASRRTFQELALLELGAVDYVRNVLLGEGKYLGQSNGDYRIFLPSENATQIARYMQHADSKLKRGLKLWRNSPKDAVSAAAESNLGARIMMKREDVKSQRELARIGQDSQ